MHLPSGDVHGPSGKTWQYNSHHVTTDLVQILTRCSPSFPGDFSLEGILILLLSGSSAKTVVRACPWRCRKRTEIESSFLQQADHFKWVLALRNCRNARRITPLPADFQAGTALQVRNHYASIAVCVCMNICTVYHNTI